MAGFFDQFEAWALTGAASAEQGAFDALPAAGELEVAGRRVLNFASMDALGLSTDARVKEAAAAAVKRYGTQGAAGSRVQRDFEERFAAFTGRSAAVALDALGAALVRFAALGTAVFADDAMELQSSQATAVASSDLGRLREREGPSLLVVPGVRPTDGALTHLGLLAAELERSPTAVLVDETWSLGILGERGAGAAQHFGVEDSVRMTGASLGGTLGARGAVLAGPLHVVRWLREQHPELECPDPASLAAATRALEIIKSEPQRRARLFAVTERLMAGLEALGLDTGPSVTPLVPVWVGDEVKCERLARALFEAGLRVRAALIPARARLVLLPQATMSDAQIDQALELMARVGRKLGLEIADAKVPVAPFELARPGTFAVAAESSAQWSTLPLTASAPAEGERPLGHRLVHAVETLTWRAASLRSSDLKRLWERQKTLRALLGRRG